jgi:chromosome segregation ATPase
VSKKRIIILAAAGLVSFAGTFALSWLTAPSAEEQVSETAQPTTAQQEMELSIPEIGTMDVIDIDEREKISAKKKQLEKLVYEVREKIDEYTNKLQQLEAREERLQIVYNTIQKDIEELNNLRVELASGIANLKEQRDKLMSSRVKIAQEEKANLVSVAAAYDRMDSTSASKILSSMCSDGQSKSGAGGFNDAVKILYYMTERTKAKLLAELVGAEPKLAAALSQRLKQIVEVK